MQGAHEAKKLGGPRKFLYDFYCCSCCLATPFGRSRIRNVIPFNVFWPQKLPLHVNFECRNLVFRTLLSLVALRLSVADSEVGGLTRHCTPRLLTISHCFFRVMGHWIQSVPLRDGSIESGCIVHVFSHGEKEKGAAQRVLCLLS